MGLIDEVKECNEEAYDKWFERWREREGLEKQLVESANKGFTGFYINCLDSDEYLQRRLTDDRTVDYVKEKLPGFDVKRERGNNKSLSILFTEIGIPYNKIVIFW